MGRSSIFQWILFLVFSVSASTLALAQVPTSVASPGVNCVQPTAPGNGLWDGSHDDTVALQNALNTAGTTGQAVCLQPGRYKYTGKLSVPTRVSVYGLTGDFNFGVELAPSGPNAYFSLDGSSMSGGWAVRQTFSNLTFQLQNSSALYGIYINFAYHLTLDHVAIYNGQNATSSALSINNVTLMECNYCVVWGNQASPSGTGVTVSGNDAGIKFSSLDIEGFATGLKSSGNSSLVLIEPWLEANMLGYSHSITGGTAQILGGMVSVFNGGLGVSIIGDHLSMQGTKFILGSGAYGFSTPSASYQDVKILGLPQISLTNMFHSTDNFMGVTIDPAPIFNLAENKVRFTKTVTSGAATNILRLNLFQNFARFRLVLTAFDGNGFQTKQYDFGITGNTIIGNGVLNSGGTAYISPPDPIITSLSTFRNSNWDLALGTLTLTPSGNGIVVGITATETGALGAGRSPTIIGELEVLNYNYNSGSINVIP